jgi:hypothetical protein
MSAPVSAPTTSAERLRLSPARVTLTSLAPFTTCVGQDVALVVEDDAGPGALALLDEGPAAGLDRGVDGDDGAGHVVEDGGDVEGRALEVHAGAVEGDAGGGRAGAVLPGGQPPAAGAAEEGEAGQPDARQGPPAAVGAGRGCGGG